MKEVSQAKKLWRANNPEKRKESNRRARERRKADPAKHEAHLQYHREWTRRRRAERPEEYTAYRKAYEQNPTNRRRKLERQKHTRYMRQYSMTHEQRDEMLAKQGNCCAICKTTDPGGRHGWHTDHCHSSGVVRGILCNNCNLMLGHSRDSTEVLETASQYLKCHQ